MREKLDIAKHLSGQWISLILCAIAGTAIAWTMVRMGLPMGIGLALMPLVACAALVVVKRPYWGFVGLFVLNYFLIAIIRYGNLEGMSALIDSLTALILLFSLLNMAFTRREEPLDHLINGLTICGFIWFSYCFLELINPTALLETWIVGRGVAAYLLVMSLTTIIVFRRVEDMYAILWILAILSLLGAAKGMVQEFIGFDSTELAFLSQGGQKTHLLASGTRYFSIYTSAAIFGGVMGHALVVFGIMAIYAQKRWVRICLLVVAAAALYGLLISGTRGALAIPGVGFALYTILSKRVKIMIPMATVCILSYVFLAMTTIGQSNQLIRRMRTAFDPNEPSLVVRRKNQKLFAEYLTDKPFGEGLGLSGVDIKDIPERFTTSIPTDSWYVKIWVETGIVGLSLYLIIWTFIILKGAYIVLFKVQNRQLQGTLSALLCGTLGVLVASYGNQVLGQFPVTLIVFMSITFVFMGPFFDKQVTQN